MNNPGLKISRKFKIHLGGLAQLGEHYLRMVGAGGSSPLPSTRTLLLVFLFQITLSACSSTHNELGGNIYKELEVDKYTIEDTEENIEKNYDAKTLLRRGEAYFDKKSYMEARDEFERFIELHPYHKLVPHAYYRVGMSYLNEFIGTDRNPKPLEDSISTFEILIKNYPNSKYTQATREKTKELQIKLAEIEFNIGKFYFKKGAYEAAIYRFEHVLNKGTFPELTEKTLYLIGVSYIKKGNPEQAADYLNRIISGSPRGKFKRKAERLLEEN